MSRPTPLPREGVWSPLVAFGRGGGSKAPAGPAVVHDGPQGAPGAGVTVATTGKPGKGKPKGSSKLHGAGNCGTGKGGFRPGNTCGKDARAKLAQTYRNARSASADHPENARSLRLAARELRHHRRGKDGAIDRDAALRHTANLKAGRYPEPVKVPAKAAHAKDKMGKAPESSAVNGSSPAHPAVKIDIHPSVVEAVHREIRAVIGPRATPHDAAALAGARPGSTVTFEVDEPGIVAVRNAGREYITTRAIFRDDDGALVVENAKFKVLKGYQGQGIGADVFGRQVEAGAAMGVARFNTTAVRDDSPDDPSNGYSTWAKFGYDGKIPGNVARKLPGHLSGADKVSDLMKTPEGREFWDKHGATFGGRFDPSPGSRSRRVWDAYRAAKKAKG